MRDIKTYLSFRIGNGFFAANVKHVHNIIEYCSITKLPVMPGFILGMANLNDLVLPVVDSKSILGMPDNGISKNPYIIVAELLVDNNQVMVGMLVDDVSEVLEIEDNQVKKPTRIGPKLQFEFIEGIYHNSEKFIMILDMDKMFIPEEVLSIEMEG